MAILIPPQKNSYQCDICNVLYVASSNEILNRLTRRLTKPHFQRCLFSVLSLQVRNVAQTFNSQTIRTLNTIYWSGILKTKKSGKGISGIPSVGLIIFLRLLHKCFDEFFLKLNFVFTFLFHLNNFFFYNYFLVLRR